MKPLLPSSDPAASFPKPQKRDRAHQLATWPIQFRRRACPSGSTTTHVRKKDLTFVVADAVFKKLSRNSAVPAPTARKPRCRVGCDAGADSAFTPSASSSAARASYAHAARPRASVPSAEHREKTCSAHCT